MPNDPASHLKDSAPRFLGKQYEALDETEQRILGLASQRRSVSMDTNEQFDDARSFGERLADRVARFGGSWAFMICFGAFLALWVGSNVALAARAVDP